MARARLPLAALVASIALAGCGSQTTPQATPTGASSPEATTSSPTRSPSATSSSSSTSAGPTSSPTSQATSSRPLRPGDEGARVRRLQQDLNAAGYWLGTPDGTYGHLTSQAVMALQKSAGLCLLYTSPSPRDRTRSRMPSSA